MAFSKLTDLGVAFIAHVCSSAGGVSLLIGKNKYPLAYTEPLIDKLWTCDIVDPTDATKKIATNDQLGKALVYWFNKYAQDFELDANVIAAQAFIESGYRMWQYAGSSTASGVSQFTMNTIFGVIIENLEKPVLVNSTTSMTTSDIAALNFNLIEGNNKNSYNVTATLHGNAYHNRPLLHQNVINNPSVMIKAQCYYMKYFANHCDSWTSTSLFCYSRGTFFAKTYSRAIQLANDYYVKHNQNVNNITEGLDYVLKIFGVLGDKENYLVSKGLPKGYKPLNYYFGYDESLGKDNPKNLRLKSTWDPFEANVKESGSYNLSNDISDVHKDSVIETLSKEPLYKFISFPIEDYVHKGTQKVQVVLHHTVSGPGVEGDILTLENEISKSGDKVKVAVAFIVGRGGEINQLYSTDYWAYHLGLTSEMLKEYGTAGITNEVINSQSVGIEIDCWGGLIYSNGNWYPVTSDDTHKTQYIANTKAKPIPVENVVEYNESNGYPAGFHGFFAFERYTQPQINSVRKIITALNVRFPAIKLEYVNDMYGVNMFGIYNKTTKQWSPVTQAYALKPGVWTHVSYRSDKSDCHPDPNLIQMLKTLK